MPMLPRLAAPCVLKLAGNSKSFGSSEPVTRVRMSVVLPGCHVASLSQRMPHGSPSSWSRARRRRGALPSRPG